MREEILTMGRAARQAAHRMAKASSSEKREALDEALTKGLTSLAGVYGYDLGYLMYILENPPAGAKTPEKFLVCGEFLECHYGAGDQAILDWLLPVRAKLNAEWKEIAAEVKKALPGSIKTGSWLWKGVMLGSKLSPDSYLTLLKFSRNFLMLNEAVMLKACQAVAEGDKRQLDCALAADKALRIGLAGYLVGLGEKIPAQ